MAADVTVFDPTSVIDHATYEDAGQLSEGIRHVLVNGRFALRDGKVTGEQAGRDLLRLALMPSRPMTSSARQAAIVGAGVVKKLGVAKQDEGGELRVALDLTQASGAMHATVGSRCMTSRQG